MTIEYLYKKFKNKIFKNRYINLNQFYNFINTNIIQKKIIGYSTNHNPIYLLKKGKSEKKILIWSQMHGNESTGTLAMLDLWNILISNKENTYFKKILQEYEIHYIPILNPDGAKIWIRENAKGIDINRDFNSENSEEIKILKQQFMKVNYILGFNLHDQRSIFSSGTSNYPATLAFLSPSIDNKKSINDIRKKSMGIINFIYENLQMHIPNQITRYSDTFYPDSTGDNFQKLGVPTILFEAGHFINNYNRHKVRKYFCFAIIYALKFIFEQKNWEKDYKKYFEIPINSNSFVDIIIKSARFKFKKEKIISDIAIQYNEKVDDDQSKLKFVPIINEINILNKKAWKLINGLKLPIFNTYPKIGNIIDYNFLNI